MAHVFFKVFSDFDNHLSAFFHVCEELMANECTSREGLGSGMGHECKSDENKRVCLAGNGSE